MEQYKANSLTLIGAVAMGTGVMIGAGIFALTGQVAELAGDLFPLAFFVATIGRMVSHPIKTNHWRFAC